MINRNHKNSQIKSILLAIIFTLGFGHLMLQTYLPALAVNFLALLIICFVIYTESLKKNDEFGFIMIIYTCSHFMYLNERGGAFNIIACFLLFAFLVKKGAVRFSTTNTWDFILITIFILSNLTGLIFYNESNMLERVVGFISFFGFILMYLFVSKTKLTEERLSMFILISVLLLVYSLGVILNKYIGVFNSLSPLTGGESRFESTNPGTMLGSGELSGEWGLLMLCFLFPFLLSSFKNSKLKINRFLLSLAVFIGLFIGIMSRSKSIFILIVLFAVTSLIWSFLNRLKVFDLRLGVIRYQLLFMFAVLLIGSFININLIFSRFTEIDFSPETLTVEGVLSGSQINREASFNNAKERLASESWGAGYGWGVSESNRRAWLPEESLFASKDGHSLYYSLPMLFGWTGSVAFMLLILRILIKLILYIRKKSNTNDYLIVVSVSFVFLFVFFLINEFKINMMRLPNYFMIFWIWLGMANSIVNAASNSFRKTKSSISPENF